MRSAEEISPDGLRARLASLRNRHEAVHAQIDGLDAHACPFLRGELKKKKLQLKDECAQLERMLE